MMKFVKKTITIKFIIICMLLLVSACANSFNHTAPNSTLNPKDFLLIETAQGNSNEQARANAITLLSQDILATTKSQFTSNQTLVNNDFNSNASNNVTVNSLSYFKDLTFSQPTQINKTNYKIAVGLSANAVNSTIKYMMLTLQQNIVNTLAYTELREESNKVNFLIALFMFAKNNNISYLPEDWSNLLSYQQTINNKLSNSSQISFHLVEPTNVNATVNINNNNYKVNQDIFLKPNTYSYTVKVNGYKSYTNNITLLSNDQTSVNVYLQKKLPHKINANLLIIGARYYTKVVRENIAGVLQKYQIHIAKKRANNRIKITFSHVAPSTINDVTYYNMPVEISFLKNNTVVLSKSYNLVSIDSDVNLANKNTINKIEEFIKEITAGDNLVSFIN